MASTIASTMADLANSLTQEEIPIKLRCASCNKLVLNAFRLPCCDQSVCETCQTSLPDTCPVCAHSPLTAEDCKPNKALRLTVKAFLKNEEKKRDKGRSDEVAVKPATPVSHVPSLVAPLEEVPSRTSDIQVEETEGTVLETLNQVQTPADAPTKSASETNHEELVEGGSTEQSKEGSAQPTREIGSITQQGIVDVEQKSGGEVSIIARDRDQQQTYNPGFGYDGMNSGLANWHNAGAYNPMMGMQTGMPVGGWGFPDMMGISSMGMNPMMMSQGIFGGFNGQGMGMTAMNGMSGMSGMSGMAGMAGMNMGMGYNPGYGGWGALGGMGGDFGGNAGYYPGSGYNQQSHQDNFHQVHHQPYANNNYLQNRSRGQAYSQRGYGRDQGYHDRQAALASQDSEEAFRQQLPTSFQGRGTSQRGQIQVQQHMQEKRENDSKIDPIKEPDPSRVGYQKAEVRDGALNASRSEVEDEIKTNLELDISTQSADQVPVDSVQQSIEVAIEEREMEHSPEQMSTDQQPIAAIDTIHIPSTDIEINQMTTMPPPVGPAIPLGPAAQFSQSPLQECHGRGRSMRGYGRTVFGHRGRGSGYMNGTFGHVHDMPVGAPLEPIGQGVMGAPTGPKAMREGQPPNGGIRGRAGFQIAGRGGKAPPTGPARTALTRASPSYELQTTRSRSGTRSKSPTSSKRRHQRKRSASVAGNNDEIENDQTRKTKYSRSSRHDDAATADDQDSRTARRSSVEASSRHRSYYDKDKHRSSRRDRSHEHRKTRDRSRSTVADYARDFDDVAKPKDAEHSDTGNNRRRSKRDSSRHRDRERYRDKDRKHSRHEEDYHRSSRNSRKPEQKTEPREFKIKDRSKQKDVVRDEHANDDAHTLEREARNTERLLKEMQRRASMGGGAGATMGIHDKRKRSRTTVAGDVNSGSGANGELEYRSSRRKLKHDGDEDVGRRGRNGTHTYEGEETAEARASRIETEREAARWG